VTGRKRDLGITLIAIGKLFKAISLVVIGIALFAVSGHDARHVMSHWADIVRIDPHNHHLNQLITKISGHSPAQLHLAGIGTFVYAALFLTEGGGLWFRKHWAEWFTIGITTSFIPLEVYELAREPGAAKIVALVLNVAAVIYLLARRIRSMTSGKAQSSAKSALTSLWRRSSTAR
jgi:uncharacterized membrane protein (DUF2068 family)